MHSARSTTIWVLLSIGAALAVLVWSVQHGQSHARVAARVGVAPAVRVVDRPAPAAVRTLLDLELGITRANVISNVDTVCIPNPCSAADVAEAKTREVLRQQAIRPAAGTAPRTVAELPGSGVLLAWHNTPARLCLAAARTSGNTSEVFGPCAPVDRNNPCTAICLASDPSGSLGQPPTYLLAGVVRGDATALRVTTSRSRTIYPLRGPILRGTDRRVFMLDLGRNDYRVLELLHGTSVIDVRELPAIEAAFEDCQAAHPAMTDFKSCIQSSGAVVPGAAFP